MSKVKIEFTKEAIVSLVGKEEPQKISKGTVMFAEDLVSKDFGSFADVTSKEAPKKKEAKEEEKKEAKKK